MQKQSFVSGVPGMDPGLPNVELILGGRTFQLCYDFNAIAQVENSTGLNLLEPQYRIQSANELRGTLWAAMLPAHPDVTLEDVGRLLLPRTFAVVREALHAAWFGSVPEPKDGDKGEVKGEASPNASPSPTSGPVDESTSGSRKKSSGGSRRGSSTSSRAGTAKA